MFFRKKKAGFTLLELAIVIILLLTIAVMCIPHKTKKTKATSHTQQTISIANN